MSVMVVGAAGYIGSHVLRLLTERGDEVVAVDDLSTGDASRLRGVENRILDVAAPGAQAELIDFMSSAGVDSVIHFAAKKQVAESVRDPLLYYRQNVDGLANVVAAASEAGANKIVFSSSAAVYGEGDGEPMAEEALASPINPYGRSKLTGEWLLADAAAANRLKAASLRYFNVAGAVEPRLVDPGITNLIPIVVDRAQRGETVEIFGDDFPTPDGTCVRDYVHVQDVALAHLAALDYLAGAPQAHIAFNIGGGAGSSIRDVIRAVEKAAHRQVDVVVEGRRAGDPASLVADVTRARETIGWTARYSLFDIVKSEWDARSQHVLS